MALSFSHLQSLAASVGFPNPDVAAAVAMAESGGDPNAYGDADYGGSVGLWQVNLPAHPNYDAQSLYDPTYNAQAAYAISSGGSNWTPWTTYRTGAYLQYMPATPMSAVAKLFARIPFDLKLAGGVALALKALEYATKGKLP